MGKQLLFPKRESTLGTTPQFILTKKIPVTIIRKGEGQWVKGRWVEGVEEELEIEANVQPMRGHELVVLPEADRTKDSIKVYSVERLRTTEEVEQKDADIVVWEGKHYRAVKTMTYKMGVLDHTKTICVRYPTTPDNMAES